MIVTFFKNKEFKNGVVVDRCNPTKVLKNKEGQHAPRHNHFVGKILRNARNHTELLDVYQNFKESGPIDKNNKPIKPIGTNEDDKDTACSSQMHDHQSNI